MKKIIFFIITLIPALAHADTFYRVGGSSPFKNTEAAACQDYVARKDVEVGAGVYVFKYVENSSCVVRIGNNSFDNYITISSTDCTSPQVPNISGVCELSSDCMPLKGIKIVKQFINASDVNDVCKNGCVAHAYDSLCLTSATPPSCIFDAEFTGASCSPDTATPIPTAADACLEKGQSSVTINGITTCVKTGTSGAAPTTTTKVGTDTSTTAAGTSTTTTTTTNNTTTNTTTTNTTTVNPDGSTTTSSEEQDTPSFCAENPNSQICKEAEKSTFSGSCNGSFSCDGDAIQCSISKEQHKRNCELFEDSSEVSNLGISSIAGTDSATSNNPAKQSNRSILNLSSSLNAGSNIGGGVFTDQHINLSGGGVTLPFSKLNFIMNILGGFLLAAAYVNAARIVGVR